MGVGGWSRSGTGHGQPGLGRARVGPGGRIGVALPVAPSVQALGDAEWIGREVLLGLWSACPGSVSRLDFAAAGEVPWSPPWAIRGVTTRGRRLDERPWYTDFFDDDYLRIFLPMLPEERTAAEVNGVVERLGLAPGARLLDLCCGHGRHAVPWPGSATG